jgi:hypothetical protein
LRYAYQRAEYESMPKAFYGLAREPFALRTTRRLDAT